jgi:hypothetical protein
MIDESATTQRYIGRRGTTQRLYQSVWYALPRDDQRQLLVWKRRHASRHVKACWRQSVAQGSGLFVCANLGKARRPLFRLLLSTRLGPPLIHNACLNSAAIAAGEIWVTQDSLFKPATAENQTGTRSEGLDTSIGVPDVAPIAGSGCGRTVTEL